MWTKRLTVAIGLALATATSSLYAQNAVPWTTDLSAAVQFASQQNRLVLIHFWTPTCGPCLQLDRTVFNQPHVGRAIADNYVPVKINAQQHPATARQYGVTSWPTDVIITPSGHVVQKLPSPRDADQYVLQMNTIATHYRSQLTQFASQSPAAGGNAAGPSPQTQPWGNVPPTAPGANPNAWGTDPRDRRDDRIAHSPFTPQPTRPEAPTGRTPFAAGTPGTSAAAPGYAERQPDYAEAQPRVARNQPANPPRGAPTLNVEDPNRQPAGTVHNPHVASRPQGISLPRGEMAGRSAAADYPPGQPPVGTDRAASRWSDRPAGDRVAASPDPARQPRDESRPQPNREPVDPRFDRVASNQWRSAQPPAGPPPTRPVAPQPGQSVAQRPVAPPPPETAQTEFPELPPGSPPLAMGGYCCVSLIESPNGRQEGDTQWGAIHLDRTYLFVSEEYQRRFLADPDRYAPVLSAYDPVRFAKEGRLVDGSRNFAMSLHKRVYLFADEASMQEFHRNPKPYADIVAQTRRTRQ